MQSFVKKPGGIMANAKNNCNYHLYQNEERYPIEPAIMYRAVYIYAKFLLS